MRVRAGEVHDKVRLGGSNDCGKRIGQLLEIVRVTGAILERDVERAGDLVERIIPPAVHGKRVDATLASKDAVRAVALMHIEIDDCRAADGPTIQQAADRYGDIVEDTKPFAVVG